MRSKGMQLGAILAAMLLVGMAFVVVVNAQGQDDGSKGINSVKVPVGIEKHFVDDGRGGEGILKNKKMAIDGENVYTKLEVDIPESGEYYVTAWVMGVNGQEEIQAYLDDEVHPVGYLKISENGWQSAQLQDKNTFNPISLTKGTHVFSFKSQDIPEIEFIRLEKQKDAAIISDTNYRNYINTLKAKSLPDNYKQLKGENQMERVTMLTSNPEGDYAYQLNMNFAYTYYQAFYFTSGQNVVFETRKSDPYASDPVMFLFSAYDPVNGGSWSNDDWGNGYQSKISVTIPNSGTYYLLLRSYSSSSPGTSDLYKDGSLYASNVALAGTNVYNGDISKTGILNYFTSQLTGDSRLWLEDSGSSPGKIRGYNDDYSGSGDFNWGLASRVKNQFSPDIRYALVSSYSSSNPTGTADLYMKLDNSNIMSYLFPNLKADDAIKSAPINSIYNCISWSGGITNDWSWPPSPASKWYDPNPLTAFDKFYGNNPSRYTGAWTYTRTGATASNSIIDLWANSAGYQHGSVKKPGNDHPHGYDWESKPGGNMRTLHPRYALRGDFYGNVTNYYIPTGTYASGASIQAIGGMTFEESIKRGLTVIEKVELSEDEKAKQSSLIENIPEEVKQEFNTKYGAWKETWDDPNLSIYSNPRMFTQSKQYEEFLGYSKEQGKAIWPLLFQKYEQGDKLVAEAIIDLIYYTEYGSFLDEIRQEKEQYTAEGAYIAPSENANMMKYIKKLLALV
ncbi:MAG: hypothetical protein WA102_09590 [Candidatus Methanoperedens sp.]